MNAALVFMAAGFGARFGNGVKQLEPVGPNGEVLMDYAVHDALAAGFKRVVFIIRRDLEAEFRSGVGRRTEKKCDVEYVFQDVNDLPAGFAPLAAQRTKPWGTGQAVLACRKVLHAPFCVLNADDYYGPQAFQQIHAWLSSHAADSKALELCMAGYVLGNTLSESGAVTRGVCEVNGEGMLTGIHEIRGVTAQGGAPCVQRDGEMHFLDPAAPVSMNIWGMPEAFIPYLEEEFVPFLEGIGGEIASKEFLLPTAVGRMIQSGRGRVCVLPTQDRWFGMTYAQDRIQAQSRIRELIAQGRYPASME